MAFSTHWMATIHMRSALPLRYLEWGSTIAASSDAASEKRRFRIGIVSCRCRAVASELCFNGRELLFGHQLSASCDMEVRLCLEQTALRHTYEAREVAAAVAPKALRDVSRYGLDGFPRLIAEFAI